MMRTMVATPGWDRLGTRVNRLVMKRVRQRCQPAVSRRHRFQDRRFGASGTTYPKDYSAVRRCLEDNDIPPPSRIVFHYRICSSWTIFIRGRNMEPIFDRLARCLRMKPPFTVLASRPLLPFSH